MTDVETTPPNIAEVLRGYSIEVNPNDPNIVAVAAARLDPGTEVYLTWIPGANPIEIVRAAARLRPVGLFPVPHVGARHLESATQLEEFAARLAGYAGVDRILLVAGDRINPLGPFDSSLAVLQTGVFQRAGISRVAVAGFPEGNPNIADSAVNAALTAKLNFALSAGLQLSIVTQFCFESQPIIQWLQRIRAQGIDVPVRVGLAGPAGLLTLARYAVRCGIGNSMRALTEKPAFARLLIEKGPESIIREIAAPATQGKSGSLPYGISGLHFFVFGGFSKTFDWIDTARDHALASAQA